MASSGNNFTRAVRAKTARAGSAVWPALRATSRKRPALTLRQSVLFTIAVIFLIVLTAVGVGVSFFVSNSEQSAWHDRQLEATYGAAGALEAFLDHHVQTLRYLGVLDTDYVRANPALLAAVIEQNHALQEVLIVRENGTFVANASDDRLTVRPEVVVESTWFQRTRQGRLYLGDVQLSASDEPYLILATPTASGNIVAARVSMSILREVVSSVRFGATGIVYIMDRDSKVIAHNNPNVTLQGLKLGISPDHIEDTPTPLYAMSDEIKGITHWHSTYQDFDGISVNGLIMLLPGTDWYVVAEVNTDEATAVSRRAWAALGGSMVTFATLVLFFTMRVLDRRLFQPIAQLRQGAQRIGAGRLDHRIVVVGENEIGQVAMAFNEMAGHLHARQKQLVAQTARLNEEVEQRRHAQAALQRARDELEAQVAERTRELRTANQQLQQELQQRQQSQEALATMEARLRHLLLTSPAIIFSIRLSEPHAINYISNNIKDATGYSPEEYYAEPKFGVIKMHPDDRARVLAEIARLGEVGRVSYEYRFQVSDGSYKWFHDDAVAVFDDAGNMREIVGSIIDIDERKRIEAEQAAIRDQAVEASRLKSEFLATVSHEIRTPLNGIIGMADLLIATPLNDEQMEYVKTMAYSADSLLVVINDVLDLSKVEAGKLTLLAGDFDPAQIAQGVADLLLPRAREKGITLDVEMANEVPGQVTGYEARVRQVLLNLVGNAVKFTEHGGVTVTVSAAPQRDATRDDRTHLALHFAVSDTGIGLDEANAAKLFQPFSQVDSSLARKYGGAGLGLAISKRLVELMGGEIGMRSTVGAGSTFWFTVPVTLVSATPPDQSPDAAPDATGSLASAAGSEAHARLPRYLPEAINVTPLQTGAEDAVPTAARPTILLVEDNLVNQRVALAQLNRMGYAVHAVNNGREAVEAVAQQDYTVILMDCQMPEMDGFEATRLIRQREARRGHAAQRQVPIIAMTANAMNGDREACLAAGMDDYIAKPIYAEALHTLLKQWIEPPA